MHEKVTDVEIYLNDVSNTVEGNSLSQELVDQCKDHMEEIMKNSTSFLFHENPFFLELTPILQRKLVECVLYKPRNAFAFFFEDFSDKNKAPEGFMVGVMT